MTARAVGAFVLAFLAIGYLFGDFDDGTDFLLAGLAAAVIGAAVAFWVDRDERKGPPDVFDERATRRAVRRGVVRTALTAVVWVIIAAIVGEGLSAVWQSRGDRLEHFRDVTSLGFQVSHAGFRQQQHTSCCGRDLRSTSLFATVEPRTAAGVTNPISLTLSLDLRGRLDDDRFELPMTGVDVAQANGLLPKSQLRRAVARLPEPVVATVVVELTRPMTPAAFYGLLARLAVVYPETGEVAVYLEPRDSIGRRVDGDRFDGRVSWPNPALAEFQAWAKQLRDGDDRVLDQLGTPSVERLRAIAASPRVHGFVLEATLPQLRGLLDEPAVRDVMVGDVALRVGLTQ